MDGFRKQILRILGELNITAEESVYCTVKGKKGRIPLAHVLALRKRGIGEIYLGDIDKFVSVDWILRENYEPPKRPENTETAARDFFISYNNKHDGERARWIAETLRSAGYTVFFQADDCMPGVSFPQWMGEAIGRSRGFVAVWSGAYEKAPFCQDELNAAYVRSRKESGYRLLLARVEDKPIQNALFQPFVRLDLLSCGDADREKLLDKVRSLASPLY